MTDSSGLYYMRQRYYNTDIRRFVNRDIVKGSIGNSQSLNRYSYVQGNPLTYTDPFGLSPEKDGGSVGMKIAHGLLELAGHAKSVQTIGKLVSNTASFAICAEQTVSTSAAMWNKYHEKGEKLSGETVLEVLSIGLNVAGMAASGKGIVESGNRLGKMLKEGGTTNKMSKGICERGSNTNGIVNGKTPASRFADKLRGLSNSKRPNNVAVVRTTDGKYYAGYNKAGIFNNNIQKVLDYLGNNNLYNRQCAEVNAISRAFNDGADLNGATISVANVRKTSDVSGVHGTI